MPAVAIDPSVEACIAIVGKINSGKVYTLHVVATYSEELIDSLEEIDGLRVDVTTDESETLTESLDVEDRSSHMLRVWIRSKVENFEPATIEPLKLLVRQIFQQVNNFDSTNGRVRVWSCSNERSQSPDKQMLKSVGLFVTSILLRVEVEAAGE